MTDIDAINRRGGSPGRRDADSHTCVFHQDFKEQQAESKTQTLNCLIAIKDRIKILESKIGGSLNIRVAGIITSVFMGFILLFTGAAFKMARDLRTDIKSSSETVASMESRIDKMMMEQMRISTIQQHVLTVIEKVSLDQEHIKDSVTEIKDRKD